MGLCQHNFPITESANCDLILFKEILQKSDQTLWILIIKLKKNIEYFAVLICARFQLFLTVKLIIL